MVLKLQAVLLLLRTLSQRGDSGGFSGGRGGRFSGGRDGGRGGRGGHGFNRPSMATPGTGVWILFNKFNECFYIFCFFNKRVFSISVFFVDKMS